MIEGTSEVACDWVQAADAIHGDFEKSAPPEIAPATRIDIVKDGDVLVIRHV